MQNVNFTWTFLCSVPSKLEFKTITPALKCRPVTFAEEIPLFPPFFCINFKTIKVQDNSTVPQKTYKNASVRNCCAAACVALLPKGVVGIRLAPFFSCFWVWYPRTDRLLITFLFCFGFGFFLIRHLPIFDFQLQI